MKMFKCNLNNMDFSKKKSKINFKSIVKNVK